jgi:hypothetical protein
MHPRREAIPPRGARILWLVTSFRSGDQIGESLVSKGAADFISVSFQGRCA